MKRLIGLSEVLDLIKLNKAEGWINYYHQTPSSPGGFDVDADPDLMKDLMIENQYSDEKQFQVDILVSGGADQVTAEEYVKYW